MNIRIETHFRPDVALVSLRGGLSARYAEDLEASVRTAMSQARVLLLDLSQLELIDSTGLGALIRCLRACLAARVRLCLVSLQSGPRMVLELTRTEQLFDIFDSLEGALEATQEVMAA